MSEQSIGAQSEDDLFSEFMGKYGDIKDAVMEAFEFDDFTNHFHFDIVVARSSQTSPEKRLKLTLEGLRYFDVSVDMVVAVQKQMRTTLVDRRSTTEDAVKEGGEGTSDGTVVESYSLCFVTLCP